ncbi:helix-turn-helix domain-containing protein [Anaeromassilibacillus senegalensis]|uniref:helix-turn-helix domain-containing protein n=1 Tax=Anaeromassilibacillus senegalensis TaxID=1673717 RepID=UPI0006828E2A|nr:helix-turn-helix domain-containing protein [Anaeromassilibacillus senegalensis]
MKHRQYLKRDPIKNYFPLPNEIFVLGLNSGEISVYSYLLYLENRKTFQCWPSYKTICKAVGMSRNTVRKYVMALEEKALISTEPTSVRTQSGQKRNGSLLYTIRLIQEALDLFYERQMARADLTAQRRHAADELANLAPVGHCDPLCGALEQREGSCPAQGVDGEFEALLGEERRTKEKAG